MSGLCCLSSQCFCCWWIPLLLLLDYGTECVQAVQGCSVFFQPDFKWKKAICDTESSRLHQIPMDLPINLIELNVKHQHIPVLSNHGLASLPHLETLQIESCDISRIVPDAFRALSKLRNLSLRNNSLQLGYNSFPKELLHSLPNLRILNLAHNPIELVPDSFFTIPSGSLLHSLFIGPTKGTALHIESNAFIGLRHLRILDLSFTRMSTMPQATEKALNEMSDLEQFYIGGNPWHCDCKLRWIHGWFMRHPRPTLRITQKYADQQGGQTIVQPTCLSPGYLNDRPIFSEKLTSSDFRCQPKMLTESQNVTVSAGNPVLLTCEFYADPVSSVKWYRDGHVVFNSSRVRNKQVSIGETHIASLSMAFSEPDDEGSWACVLEEDNSVAKASFNVIIKPNSGSILSGMSINQQHWIYAGTGAFILFVLLTLVGIGIYYCCDPRSNTDQALQSLVGKSQAGRLKHCCGSARYLNNPTDGKQHNSGSENKEDLSNGGAHRSRSNSSSPHNSLLRAARTIQVSADASVSKQENPQNNVTSIPELVSIEQTSGAPSRLLVSCDGTQQAVILAARLSQVSSVESPSSVYGISNVLDYQISPSLTSNYNGSNLQPINYIAHSAFEGHLLKPSVKSPHIYARVSAQTGFQHAIHLPHISTTKHSDYTTPCPVHGSVNIERLKLSSIRNDEECGVDQAELKTSGLYTNSSTFETEQSLEEIKNSQMREQSNISNRALPKNCGKGTLKYTEPLSIYTTSEVKRGNSFELVPITSANQYEFCLKGEGHNILHPTAIRLSSSSSVRLNHVSRRNECSQKESISSESPISSSNTENGSYKQTGTIKPREYYHFPNHPIPCASWLSNASMSKNRKGNVQFSTETKHPLIEVNDSMSSSCSDETYDCSRVSNSTASSSPNQLFRYKPSVETRDRLTPSPTHSLRLEKRKSLCAVHFPSWRGYASQLVSPSSSTTGRTVYHGACTLPTNSRISKAIHSLPFLGDPYQSSCKSLHNYRSQTFVRPGSKHKLDTDSGTDYND